ncbi:DUF2235 domain-containing protein, partial [Pseudomonas syringae]
GDQGKAISKNALVGDALLLSQIALNDLYADAFAHGSPLKVPKDSLPLGLRHESWREMAPEIVRSFDVTSELVTRFNAWRQMTLGLPPVSQPLSIEQIEHYQPLTSATT